MQFVSNIPNVENLPKGSLGQTSQWWITSQGIRYFHTCYNSTLMMYKAGRVITHILQLRKL